MDCRIVSSCQYFKEFDDYYVSDFSCADILRIDFRFLFGGANVFKS